ncbi:glutamate-5-semialdehyde dehydrogenase [uncultured Duncaniella sp.]|uniref:glutamate-5-semialdehyde dehydrogenase n=2 Tax=uncultured Duncaniella sp. TaxID=2768039 RepID=UPI000F47EE40|nr:glutamate-5-semialdehyde dehydrogenase [uncultured Duncaniella sp.]ROS90514.1 glutamate-5-semialdehyde dehydrogenase [Muribaculaceae bacterium Isolate-080 (Janvier)]
MSDIKLLLSNVKRASRSLMSLTDARRAEILMRLADAVDSSHEVILRANAEDLSRMERSNPLYDRLLLSPKRLTAIAGDIRHVAELPSPVGEVIEDRTLPNGLRLRRVRVPFGVIGVIYEARPNVTFDVFSLCFRSGNACVLKGGSDASASNEAIVSLIHKVLDECGVDTDCVCLLPSSHEATAAMLGAVGYVDVCIPRGGRRLIDFVRDNARVPVIETGAGVVSAYFDKDGDIDMGRDIITNAKTRRVSVCNALDTLLIHHNRLADLPLLCERLSEKNVEIFADEVSGNALAGHYPAALLHDADAETYSTEWMDYKMGIRTVGSVDDAIEHIAHYGSGHSECIITENHETADRFQQSVDAACVYVNAPTSFTDGAQFGLGAEIGISTQKLGPRGPMGLREITTYRYFINGNGQTRP